MTEEEAKAKWCPFARYASRNGMAINRWVNADDKQLNPEPARCIGSACMAWRWEPKAGVDDEGKPKFYPGPWQGYCGMAGKP